MGLRKTFRSNLLVCAAVMVATAGCARPFPEYLPLMMGNDPNPYSLAFVSAATEAFVEARTGRNMYALLDHRPYSLGGNDLCTDEGVEAFLVRHVSRCSVIERATTAECYDTIQCMRFRISPAVKAEPRYLAAVEAALRRPCAHLTDWRTVKWGETGTSLGIAPKHSARMLQCDDREVIGANVTRSADGEFFPVQFELAI